MAEWNLTEGEAKGLLSGQASQTTIDKILDHPRGGFRLGLQVLEIRMQTALTSFVQTERERIAHERREQEERDAALARMAHDLPAVLGLGARRPGPGAVRRDR